MSRIPIEALYSGIAVLALAAGPVAAAAQDEVERQPRRPTLAIVEFETRPAGTVLPPPGLGSALAEMMLDRLVASGQYRVLDGRWLPQAQEHEKDAVQRMRRELEDAGVDYVVFGSLQRFSTENRRRAYGGGAVIPLLAGIRRNKVELAVAIMVRVVDVRTGEVATTATSQGAADRKNLSVGGVGLFSRGGAGGFSNSASGSRDAMLDEAIRRAVATAAQGVINAAARLSGS